MKKRNKPVIPGFGLSMGITISILSLVVLIPLASLVVYTATVSYTHLEVYKRQVLCLLRLLGSQRNINALAYLLKLGNLGAGSFQFGVVGISLLFEVGRCV